MLTYKYHKPLICSNHISQRRPLVHRQGIWTCRRYEDIFICTNFLEDRIKCAHRDSIWIRPKHCHHICRVVVEPCLDCSQITLDSTRIFLVKSAPGKKYL